MLGAFDASSGAAAITGAAVVKSKIAWSVEAPPSPESTNWAIDVMERNVSEDFNPLQSGSAISKALFNL
ncbi:hypothetical protein HRE53_06860 [Acaryochloris sp. 'Moss Beach']|uniref:hypothetical protein n=1 Tax=Acaryochloris sp. 'Moss Beach' TaxID=2740837 RepID=UPI001F2DAD20|nr:hypothetical protein [Acaryochloris sp. 'Moss Beach']UJB72217.1 hypothetical protein HRE53_06860 [Acaryochloris sp. 'Moss Beach']